MIKKAGGDINFYSIERFYDDYKDDRMNTIKRISYILIILLTAACKFNNEYINREKDNNDGKAFLKQLYFDIKSKRYLSVDSLISDSLRIIANGNGVSQLLKTINSKAGNYKSFVIQDYHIRSVSGSINETSYIYKLKVFYDKGQIDEIVGLKRQNDSPIKINSYHAYSNLLIQ